MVFRCGECIGCFQSEDCGRCAGCTSSSSCLRRKCVQESVLANRKPAGALAQRREQIRKEVQSEVVKKDVKREATPTAVKRGPGRPRKEAGQANARAGAQVVDTARTGMDERAPPRRSTATRARGETRRKHDAPKQPESRQCIEPDCVNEAREDSKYCSDECGLKLAKMRLLMLLPQKVAQYYGQQPLSELQSLEELRAIDQKIGKIQAQTETMLGYVRAIQRYVMAMKSTTSVSYDEPGDVDFMVNCTVCGMETNGRQLPKHVERCFVKSEKQTSFGTATPAAFNPDNLFCEAYNKANNTYCKRVRVICAEHYKGELENELQALVGTIECERMNLLTRLDELLERRKVVSVGCSTRGDVISLLNFQPPVIVDSSK